MQTVYTRSLGGVILFEVLILPNQRLGTALSQSCDQRLRRFSFRLCSWRDPIDESPADSNSSLFEMDSTLKYITFTLNSLVNYLLGETRDRKCLYLCEKWTAIAKAKEGFSKVHF
jgi:hypothetical protein